MRPLVEGILMSNVIVTGGAGFIGSAVVRKLINDTGHRVLVLDKLTYAGNLESLGSVADHSRFHFTVQILRNHACSQ